MLKSERSCRFCVKPSWHFLVVAFKHERSQETAHQLCSWGRVKAGLVGGQWVVYCRWQVRGAEGVYPPAAGTWRNVFPPACLMVGSVVASPCALGSWVSSSSCDTLQPVKLIVNCGVVIRELGIFQPPGLSSPPKINLPFPIPCLRLFRFPFFFFPQQRTATKMFKLNFSFSGRLRSAPSIAKGGGDRSHVSLCPRVRCESSRCRWALRQHLALPNAPVQLRLGGGCTPNVVPVSRFVSVPHGAELMETMGPKTPVPAGRGR